MSFPILPLSTQCWLLALMGDQPDKLISHLTTPAPWWDRQLQPAICLFLYPHRYVVLLSNYLHPDYTNFMCKIVPAYTGHEHAKCFSCHRDGNSSASVWAGLFSVFFAQFVLNSQKQTLAWAVALQRSTKTQLLALTLCCCDQQMKPAKSMVSAGTLPSHPKSQSATYQPFSWKFFTKLLL